MSDDGKPVALIFRSTLLARSETFVKAQCESLERYTGRYVGLWRDQHGLTLDPDRVSILSAGRQLRLLLHPSRCDVSMLARFNPRIIHAHFGTDAVLARPLARALRVPLIVTFHGYDVTVRPDAFRRGALGFGLNQLYPARLKRLFPDPNVSYLAVSSFIRDQAIALGCPPSRINVHYIGVDVSEFSAAGVVEPVARRNRILFVGRLVEKKGCRYLIEAVRRLAPRVPGLELRIVGDGPLRVALQREAAAAGLPASFLGVQPMAVVRAEMEQARILSVPCLIAGNGDADGLPMVFVEAQSMGLPVVSFASGGIVEAVEHGVTGLLAEEGNIDQLTSQLDTLLRDDALWHVFAQKGRERVMQKFSLRDQSRVLEHYYDTCMTGQVGCKLR